MGVHLSSSTAPLEKRKTVDPDFTATRGPRLKDEGEHLRALIRGSTNLVERGVTTRTGVFGLALYLLEQDVFDVVDVHRVRRG